MLDLQALRTSTWAFLEAYGWLTVFLIIVTYVIYKKYIYNVMRAHAEERRIKAQEIFDREVQEKEKERVRLARERQQKEHDEKEKIERIKREEKEKEEAEKRKKEWDEQEKTCNVLGHNPTTSSASTLQKNDSTDDDDYPPLAYATEIVDCLPETAAIIIFGYSSCPNLRKACQLISTYRFNSSHFQVFEFDKQPDWPMNEVLEQLELRYSTRESPFVFVSGKYIGGLEAIRDYDKEHGLDKAKKP